MYQVNLSQTPHATTCLGKDLHNEISCLLNGGGNSDLVVCALDSRTYHCGFADRIRGMITCYAFAKANGYSFYLEHKEPFVIEQYLMPNKYNWQANKNSVTYNMLDVDIVMILDTKRQAQELFRHHRHSQIHIYTNTDLLCEINSKYQCHFTFHELFNELFKPSVALQQRIIGIESKLQQPYVSVSLRFVNLLGDFPEKGSVALNDEEQQKLIAKCIGEICIIKAQHTHIGTVLVTADSMKFVKAVSALQFVYVIPGETGHSGYDKNDDTMMKTMLDFHFISQAEKVYLIQSNGMYASHFAETAAHSQGKEFVKWIC